MKRRLTPFLALLLAAVYLLALAPAVLAAEGGVEAYEEPVTIKVLSTDNVATNSTINYDANDPRRVGPNDNVWIDAYKEYLNIDVERLIADDGTALNAMVNTMMASGDLPDVVIIGKNTFYTMAENGVLMDLTDLWANYAHKEILGKTYTDELLKTGMVDGELLGLPSGANFYGSTKVLWLRTDWLAKVGKEIPQTWDEMIDVAKAFKEAQLGGTNTIPLGIQGTESGAFEAFDAPLKTWRQEEDGRYIYENVSDRTKEALLALQGLYKEGLISKDFATSSTLIEETANGMCGMLYGQGWCGATFVKNSLLNDAEAVWEGVKIPTYTGEATHQWTNNTVGSFIVVNAACKNPEAVLRLIDLEMYLTYVSDKGETYYNYKDANGADVSIWNLRTFRDVGYGSDFDLNTGRVVMDLLDAGVRDVNEAPAFAQNWFNRTLPGYEADTTDRSARGMFCSLGYGYRTITAKLESTPELLVGEYGGPVTDTMSLYWTSIDEALTAAMLEVIMGADISVYETAVTEWYASGGQTITDEVNAYYASET